MHLGVATISWYWIILSAYIHIESNRTHIKFYDTWCKGMNVFRTILEIHNYLQHIWPNLCKIYPVSIAHTSKILGVTVQLCWMCIWNTLTNVSTITIMPAYRKYAHIDVQLDVWHTLLYTNMIGSTQIGSVQGENGLRAPQTNDDTGKPKWPLKSLNFFFATPQLLTVTKAKEGTHRLEFLLYTCNSGFRINYTCHNISPIGSAKLCKTFALHRDIWVLQHDSVPNSNKVTGQKLAEL